MKVISELFNFLNELDEKKLLLELDEYSKFLIKNEGENGKNETE